MTIIVNQELKLTTTDCCTCGIVFAVAAKFLEKLREDKQTFYCPNGHPMVFTKSKAQELQQEIDKLKKEKDEVEHSRWSLHQELTQKQEEIRKMQAATKRRNKRIAAGVCPCCNKTFKQLAAHMKQKHPEQVENFPVLPIHSKINKKAV